MDLGDNAPPPNSNSMIGASDNGKIDGKTNSIDDGKIDGKTNSIGEKKRDRISVDAANVGPLNIGNILAGAQSGHLSLVSHLFTNGIDSSKFGKEHILQHFITQCDPKFQSILEDFAPGMDDLIMCIKQGFRMLIAEEQDGVPLLQQLAEGVTNLSINELQRTSSNGLLPLDGSGGRSGQSHPPKWQSRAPVGSNVVSYRVSSPQEISEVDPLLVVEYPNGQVVCELSPSNVYWAADLKVAYHYVMCSHFLDKSLWSNQTCVWIKREHNYISDTFGIVWANQDKQLRGRIGKVIKLEDVGSLLNFLKTAGSGHNKRDPS